MPQMTSTTTMIRRLSGLLERDLSEWEQQFVESLVEKLDAGRVTSLTEPCVGNDPTCPCQDGDACHYRDTDRTKAWPIPDAEPEREPTLQERVKLVTEEPDAWLITCRAPGRWMEYATVDENDSNHWPVDQWTSIVKAPLYLHLDHVAPQAEPKRLTVEVSLAAGHGYHGYWGVAIGSGVLRFALAAPFATLTEADEYAETLRTALGITGGSDAE